MTNAQFGILAALLAALLGVAVYPLVKSPGPVATKPAAKVQWEYRIEGFRDGSAIDELNTLGRDGWDVVSARRAIDDARNGLYEVILRRQYVSRL